MEIQLIFFASAVILIGGVLLYVITFMHHGLKELDQEKYRLKWLEIENKISPNDLMTYQFAVLNADKLLDEALREKGIRGETMGHRLNNAVFSDRQSVWSAHKLRNRIAHETNVKVDIITAKKALASFKQALKDTGAI